MPEARSELIGWLPSVGFTHYAYGPKHDPYHRDQWRLPYPEDHLAHFRHLLEVASGAGIEVVLGLSPGLDWRGEVDNESLIAKCRQLYDCGVRWLGIYWDDVAPGGEDLGRRHGSAVAAAVAGMPDDLRWLTVGTDYATSHVTAYLRGLADTLPAGIPIAWTGPAITSAEVPAELAARLADELGHPLFFADNWPVNDLGMEGVLHLGPVPYRDPALREVVTGVGYNLMSRPLASRPGLELAARHWRDPAEDRQAAWEEVTASYPGLAPLARACRSWLTDPGPDPELLSWIDPALLQGDDRLLEFLSGGCRAGLPDKWQAELGPWLGAWEEEAALMTAILRLLRSPDAVGDAPDLSGEWCRFHARPFHVFGIRFAIYGLSYRAGDRQLPHPGAVVHGENLTDIFLRRTLEILHAAASR